MHKESGTGGITTWVGNNNHATLKEALGEARKVVANGTYTQVTVLALVAQVSVKREVVEAIADEYQE